MQGLVRYIYTGQLSAPRIQGSSWEKIIEDFKVGFPLENDDDLASIHELTDYGEASPVVSSLTYENFINTILVILLKQYEPETNGVCHLQHSHHHTYQSVPTRSPAKGVGPKIVAVTSPRPLIVQVQSLTQPQSINHGLEIGHDVNDIPSGKH